MTIDPPEFSQAEVPSAHYNPPGMSAIAYRYGTHATVFQRLLSRLRQQEIPESDTAAPSRPLQTLSLHDRDDPGIALLDTWAMVADVLSFYQERIANEGYLRTVIEDRSILELSRTIGYELRSGVAASTPLIFTVEDAPGSEPAVIVPQGTQVQSIPTQPGELPQTFETAENFQAQVKWNCLTPDLEQKAAAPAIEATTTELKLQGTSTQLQPGDVILMVEGDLWYWLTLTRVKPDSQANYTLVSWGRSLSEVKPNVVPPTNPQVFAFRQRASLFGYNASLLNNQLSGGLPIIKSGAGRISGTTARIVGSDTSFTTELKKGDIIIVENQVRTVMDVTGATSLTVEAGFNPGIATTEPKAFNYISREIEWSNFNIRGTQTDPKTTQIDLDTVYPKVLPQSWIVLSQKSPSDKTKLCQIQSAAEVFRSDFGLASKITRMSVKYDADLANFDLRQTSVFVQSEKLERFEETSLKHPIQIINGKTTIPLDRIIPHLKPTQSVIISGSKNNRINHEVASVESMKDIDGHTTLTLMEALSPDYDPLTLKIYANVILATHGETVTDEVLGSGDGTKLNQQFMLKKPPLTYVSATAFTGVQSTLKIYVNQVLWRQVRSLHNQDARSQCYIAQTNEQGQTRIIFGDGIQGARLPSGQENVRATYRSGIGQAGEVKAGSLILLQNRPLGIREVTNLLSATGAADRDNSDYTRQNAPRTVLTLDHVVSLRDFENFARSFSGIGKAQATLIWTGEMRQIYITVTDVHGQAAPSTLCDTLKAAIAVAGNGLQPVQVMPYHSDEGLFNLNAKVLVDDRYRFESVEPQIRKALQDAFSFQKREFGQGVAASEVIQIIQGVEGVVAVDLDEFYLASQRTEKPQLESFLSAKSARWDGQAAKPAQILLLNSQGTAIVLREWA